jgi:uncharacterized protein
MDSPIIHEQREGGGAFFLARDGMRIAEITYRHAGPGIAVFDHTEVDPSLRGQGMARLLFDAALAWARASGTKITPRCSYVVAQFRRDPSLADVLA